MIDNYLAFIKKKLNSTNYLDYYDDIIDLLENNHQNIQKLLLNKKLNFENMKYYSKKKNKLLYEFINNKNFNNFICNLLNKIYDNNINYELNHNTLVNIKTKIPNINNNLRKKEKKRSVRCRPCAWYFVMPRFKFPFLVIRQEFFLLFF